MKLDEIEKIIKVFEAASISHLDLEIDNIKIKLDKNDTVYSNACSEDFVVSTEEATYNENEVIVSPMVGTFHTSPYPNADPFVNVGDSVKKGDKLCIIEAMKVMNEITCSRDGIVKEILATNGQMVEYGQKLFVIGE